MVRVFILKSLVDIFILAKRSDRSVRKCALSAVMLLLFHVNAVSPSSSSCVLLIVLAVLALRLARFWHQRQNDPLVEPSRSLPQELKDVSEVYRIPK